MKIKKIYESNNLIDSSMKTINEYVKMRDEYNKLKYDILNKIEHFITLNEEYFLDEYGLKNNFLILKDFEFKDLDEYTEFRIISVDGRIYPLRRKDFNDLAAFLDDPDLYKNTKKYNL